MRPPKPTGASTPDERAARKVLAEAAIPQGVADSAPVRSQLTPDQLAVLAALQRGDHPHGGDRRSRPAQLQRALSPPPLDHPGRAHVALRLGISVARVRRAVQLLRRSPRRARAVLSGVMCLSAALHGPRGRS
jgi:hypothetical protein